MKNIILVTGPDGPKLEARVAALYAEAPEDRRIIRTRDDIVRWLSKPSSTAIVKTLPAVLEIRRDALTRQYPDANIEVVQVA